MTKDDFFQYGLAHTDDLVELVRQFINAGTHRPGFDFILDRVEGENAEDLLKQVLRGTIEVKLDRRMADTGNLCVEMGKVRGRQVVPSGLNASSADWWAFIAGGEADQQVIILVKSSYLRTLVKYKGRDNARSGTGNLPFFRLVSIADLFTITPGVD